jgi:hypothetical protein
VKDERTPSQWLADEIMERHRRETEAMFFGPQPAGIFTTAQKHVDYGVVDDPLEILVETCGCMVYLARRIRTCAVHGLVLGP